MYLYISSGQDRKEVLALMARMLRLSVTSIKTYLSCGRKYYFYRNKSIPKRTDHPRLCGASVHSHIEQLYRPTKTPRPFYFKSPKSSVGAWFNRWERALSDNRAKGRLITGNENDDTEYRKVGLICVAQYWKANYNLTRPVLIEHEIRVRLQPNVIFVGILDQVRLVSLEFIAKHRPELVIDGQLHPDYEPVVIVDLKTNKFDYDTARLKNPTEYERVRAQYNLHEDLQATAYTWLYQQETGKKPVGFMWYHLRSGMTFFTFRENKDYLTLFGVIEHIVANLEAQSYPKYSTEDNCRRCDYVEPCWEKDQFFISPPEIIAGEVIDPETIANIIEIDPNRQLRMKLSVPRVKLEKPQLMPPGKIVVSNAPWWGEPDDELAIEEGEEPELIPFD